MKETLKSCFMGFVAIAALLTLIIACHKDPTPSPTPEPTPGQDTTQVIDTTTYPDTIWFKLPRLTKAPDMDSVIFYASKSSVKKIIMELEPLNSTGWSPAKFHAAHDTLQLRFDVAPSKVRGAGTIYVCRDTGAQMPDPNETNLPGMAVVDSAWYVEHGWEIKRGCPFQKSR